MSETHVVEKMETDLNTTNQSADSGEILTLMINLGYSHTRLKNI